MALQTPAKVPNEILINFCNLIVKPTLLTWDELNTVNDESEDFLDFMGIYPSYVDNDDKYALFEDRDVGKWFCAPLSKH